MMGHNEDTEIRSQSYTKQGHAGVIVSQVTIIYGGADVCIGVGGRVRGTYLPD